jgi:photosystem II stability/assembly factor-like uncharacterized protein
MKTIILIFSFSVLLQSCLLAQSGWFPLTSGTSEALWSSFFNSENTGYVGGSNSTLLKTVNAGANWTLIQLSPAYTLKSIFFTDLNTGYIAGGGGGANSGTIFKTTNAGINWSEVTLPFYKHLYTVFFVNSNTGYAGGYGVIFKTTDAGVTWINQTIPAEISVILTVYMRDANTGYATGGSGGASGYLIKTTNGGTNWQLVYTYAGAALGSVAFVDANTGVAVAGGSSTSLGGIIRTTDGGNNWVNLNYTTGIINLWSIRFVNSSIGYITGATPFSGAILKTTNAGSNWCPYGSFISQFLFTSFFTSINTGYAVGFTGMILKTTDGGGNCFVGVNPSTGEIPEKYSLEQNYPNPFNPVTVIKFDIPKASYTKLTVYDVLGREVIRLVDKKMEAGSYEVTWDASSYASGTYIYKFEAGDYISVRKMIFVK